MKKGLQLFRVILSITALLYHSPRALAQDAHMTQYGAMPLLTNPALTGWHTGNCRLAMLYREQWKAIGDYPYSTAAFSAERQHQIYTEQINYGAVLINDRSGAVGLTNNSAILSGSYFRELSGNKLQAGMQVGITSSSVNTAKLSFDSQFDIGGEDIFNNGIASGEAIDGSKTYVDLNAGLLWSRQLTEKIRTDAGTGFFHLNMPNTSLYGDKNADTRLAIKSIIHADATIKMLDKLTLTPGLIYIRQKKATEMLVGGLAEYDINIAYFKSIYGGARFRYGMADNYDAAALIGGIKFLALDFGISYDFNISQLQEATNNKGALEFSLRYLCKSTKVKKVKVSCDRM